MKGIRKKQLMHGLEFTSFVLPAFFMITLFVGVPFAMCVYYSFRKWNGISKTITFIGMDNYVRIFTQDTAFVGSIGYTLLYALCVVVFVNAIALLLAALLESGRVRAKGLFRTCFYIPNIVSLVIIGFIWKFIFGRVFEDVARMSGSGLFALSWLGDRHLAVISVIYWGLGAPMAIFLYHGFTRGIPKELEECALLDGCSPWRIFTRIVFPLLQPVTASVIVVNAMWLWNDFLLPLLIIGTSKSTKTLQLAAYAFMGQYKMEWQNIMAAAMLSIIPALIIYLIFQKNIVKGLVAGAIKG